MGTFTPVRPATIVPRRGAVAGTSPAVPAMIPVNGGSVGIAAGTALANTGACAARPTFLPAFFEYFCALFLRTLSRTLSYIFRQH